MGLKIMAKRKEAWVFCQKVSDNFENETEVLEGQYGKWFSKNEAMAEKNAD